MEQEKKTNIENNDRRQNQRFIARRSGTPCFWISYNNKTERIPLDDLSLEGFGILTSQPSVTIGGAFDFVLHREGLPDQIRGRANAVNHFSGTNGNVVGCRFISLEDDGAERLQEWLVAHVIINATIRITEKEALAIVKGRSLV